MNVYIEICDVHLNNAGNYETDFETHLQHVFYLRSTYPDKGHNHMLKTLLTSIMILPWKMTNQPCEMPPQNQSIAISVALV